MTDAVVTIDLPHRWRWSPLPDVQGRINWRLRRSVETKTAGGGATSNLVGGVFVTPATPEEVFSNCLELHVVAMLTRGGGRCSWHWPGYGDAGCSALITRS